MSRIDETIQAKKEKRSALENSGVLVHPYSFDKESTIAQAREMQEEIAQTAGRIMSLRPHGKAIFLDLQDSTSRIQVLVRASDVSEADFALFDNIDRGDFLAVSGKVGTSKTGEITIVADAVWFMGKALRPIPTGWNAAEDKEARFRQRYVDMLINENTKQLLDARWKIIRSVRRYLEDEHAFVEVETPILQPLYGGTNARPFTTHMNALDCDFYLRVAPELYLKRLIVGGYDKVFEIARNFRNEGIDQTHQPEFTMIEWYETYADYNRMMDVAEGLIQHVATQLNGSTRLKIEDREIEIGHAWPRVTMKDALLRFADINFDESSDVQLQASLEQHKIELQGEFTRGKAQFMLFDKLVAPQLIEPIWIIDYPRDVSPLAKQHREFPELAERYEAYMGGKELADGWSEITDPIDQRNVFDNEQRRLRSGDAEAHPMDEDFLEAMEYGMPPLGGIGIGIDRLVMFLTNTWSIREVIAFPTLRPVDRGRSLEHPTIQNKPTSAAPVTDLQLPEGGVLPAREVSQQLLDEHIKNDALKHHCIMVAQAMEAYAKALGEDAELWYQTGLLHDLDWEEHPDEHPKLAVSEWLAEYPLALREAILAHAPHRTGKNAVSLLDKYLFACDELSGIMHAASLMRPNGFADMEVKSVKKKLKDKSFAVGVNRDDVAEGFALIGKTPEEHIAFLIDVFKGS